MEVVEVGNEVEEVEKDEGNEVVGKVVEVCKADGEYDGLGSKDVQPSFSSWEDK